MDVLVAFFCLGNKTLGVQYITSLYWAAATSASVGYGDIHAYTASEVWYYTNYNTIRTFPYPKRRIWARNQFKKLHCKLHLMFFVVDVFQHSFFWMNEFIS